MSCSQRWAASITGDFISRMVYGLGPVFDFSSVAPLALGQYWMVLLLGVALDWVGAFYNFCIGKVQDLYSYIPGQFLRTLLPFLLAGILMTVYPAVLGGGHSLVELVSEDQLIQSLVFSLCDEIYLLNDSALVPVCPAGSFSHCWCLVQ